MFKRNAIFVLVLLIAGFVTADETKDTKVKAAWTAYKAASGYEECADISRRILEEYPENKYAAIFITSIINNDYHRQGKHVDTIAYLENLISRTENVRQVNHIQFKLLELYGISRLTDKFNSTFDKLMALEKLNNEDYYQLMRICSENDHWDALKKSLMAAEEGFTQDDMGKGYFFTFKAWWMANNGQLDDALSLFKTADSLLPKNVFGVSVFPMCYLFLGKAQLLKGGYEAGIENIAKGVFMEGDSKLVKHLRAVYVAKNGNDDGFESEVLALRTKYAPTFPDFTAYSYDGKEHTFSKLTGKLTLLHFWAASCSPCHRLLVRQKSTFDKYREKGLSYVAYSLEPNKMRDRMFIAGNKLEFTFLTLGENQNTRDQAAMYGVKIFPTILLIDEQGRILYRYVNFHIGDEHDIEKDIARLLD